MTLKRKTIHTCEVEFSWLSTESIHKYPCEIFQPYQVYNYFLFQKVFFCVFGYSTRISIDYIMKKKKKCWPKIESGFVIF